MAQKVRVELIDDLDGGVAHETVSFALDGVEYQIDVSNVHAETLRDAFREFSDAGRKVAGVKAPTKRRDRRGQGPTKSGFSTEELREVRAWANDNGYRVSERGVIKSSVLDAYRAAHGMAA